MSVIAVILFGLCVTSVWAECGTCNKTTQCTEEPTESQCEFGVVKDACNCCSQCAKGIGQPCGTGRNTAAGICAPGLICKLVSPRQPSRCDEDPNAGEKIAVQELPAEGIHGENIKDGHIPEEIKVTSTVAPSSSQDTVSSTTQVTPGQRETTRNNQEQRPLRPTHITRTTEKPSETTTELPAQTKSETEQEVPPQHAEERQTPAINTQERQTPNTPTQGTPQRVRGNVAQNGRTRSEVPAQRERTPTTEVPANTETEPHQQETGEQDHAAEDLAHVQEEQGETHNEDATKTREDPEVSQQQNHKTEEAQQSHKTEEDEHSPKTEEAQLSHNTEDEASHSQSEVEEQEPEEPLASEGQNQRSQSETSLNNNRNDQNGNQSNRPLIRRTRMQRKEPTPRHDHEGSIQNLNAEDKNENYSHDNPFFDNRTNK